ncbi:MAG: NERD domain-containing protein [Lachnospiraceae bacterium]|nr:NERD domain-containing protein [Lachnospiraceae bacterium]
MGILSKNEVVILKKSTASKEYLAKLQALRQNVSDEDSLADELDKEIAIVNAGIYGEESVLFELQNSDMDLVVIQDLFLKTKDGRTAQIDFFVITPYANVIIECKNLFGNITINEKGDFVRTFNYGKRYYKSGIYSPITQNERHLSVYKECRQEDKNILIRAALEKGISSYTKSVVVLANSGTVVHDKYAPKEIKNQVIRCDRLIRYLKSIKTDVKSSKKEMLALGEKVLVLDVKERTDYLKKYQELFDEYLVNNNSDIADSETTVESENDTCPWCGNKLVLRTATKGKNAGNKFYGCSTFPKCRFIRNIKGIDCEK